MRSIGDRLRHTISFEIIGLLLATPLGALAFGLPMFEMGVVGAGSAAVAALWNYLYNWGFDHALVRLGRSTRKGKLTRLLHAVLFEVGLMALLMPPIALYLGIGLWEAFLMDAAFALFYMAYGFVFNLAYDRLFPLPEWGRRA